MGGPLRVKGVPMTVTVTWMDRTQEIYPGVEWETDGALLWLTDAKQARCVPLASVKIWTVT